MSRLRTVWYDRIALRSLLLCSHQRRHCTGVFTGSIHTGSSPVGLPNLLIHCAVSRHFHSTTSTCSTTKHTRHFHYEHVLNNETHTSLPL